MQQRRIRLLIITALFLVLAIFGALTVYNRRFRVVRTVPDSTGTVSTSFTTFLVETNRDLDTSVDYMKQLDDPDKHVTSIEVEGRSLRLGTKEHNENQKYHFSIQNVKAKNGEVIGVVPFDYTAKYVPYEKFTKAERDLLASQQANVTKSDPILSYLPHSTLNFNLAAEYGEPEGGNTSQFVLKAKLFLTEADMNISETEATERYKKEVNDYIISLGLKPESYIISYVPIKP